MKRVLASVGIGSATVDTVLASTTVTPGETVPAEIHVRGGDAEQSVDAIDITLETRYATESGYVGTTVGRDRLVESFGVDPGEESTYETELTIPYATPLTLGQAGVWVETELEMAMTVDPEDYEYLDVRPTARMQTVFDAANELGLSLRAADCTADPDDRYVGSRPFVQPFEFRPEDGPFGSDVDEVELLVAPDEESLTVFVEVDRGGGVPTDSSGGADRPSSFSVAGREDAVTVRERLADEIERNV
jgi:sporulation-control protein